MNRILIGVAAVAIAVPALAQLQPAVPSAPLTASTQTRAEVSARVQDHFAKLDSNRDGYIAADEMQAMRGPHPNRAGMRGHRNRMAMRDWPMANPDAMFDRLDANRDGMISREEFAKAREMRMERKIALNGAPGALGGARDGLMRMRWGAMRGHMIKLADSNKDGRITLQEMTAAALQHFDRVDANHDGRITPDERQLMHRQMMQEHGRNAG